MNKTITLYDLENKVFEIRNALDDGLNGFEPNGENTDEYAWLNQKAKQAYHLLDDLLDSANGLPDLEEIKDMAKLEARIDFLEKKEKILLAILKLDYDSLDV